mmetsp:Transcript_24264/g.47085  ORF Transcript_24264/g.47085 Transcript_24264/m.47085 type:complete len:240 (+) Transcript_24264:520-1239(+)
MMPRKDRSRWATRRTKIVSLPGSTRSPRRPSLRSGRLLTRRTWRTWLPTTRCLSPRRTCFRTWASKGPFAPVTTFTTMSRSATACACRRSARSTTPRRTSSTVGCTGRGSIRGLPRAGSTFLVKTQCPTFAPSPDRAASATSRLRQRSARIARGGGRRRKSIERRGKGRRSAMRRRMSRALRSMRLGSGATPVANGDECLVASTSTRTHRSSVPCWRRFRAPLPRMITTTSRSARLRRC